MNTQIYPVLGTPGVGFLSLLIIGGIAGWIAERITSSNHGLLTNILVGICGSFIGSQLAQIADIPLGGFLRHLISATIGSIILIYVWQALRGRQQPPAQGRTPIDKI